MSRRKQEVHVFWSYMAKEDLTCRSSGRRYTTKKRTMIVITRPEVNSNKYWLEITQSALPCGGGEGGGRKSGVKS